MKKFFFSCLAIAAIASCAKTEPVFMAGESEIVLSPVTRVSTKTTNASDGVVNGVLDGTQYPVAENFDVYAYWKNLPAGEMFTRDTTEYLTAVTSGVQFVNKGAFWGGTDVYYWPKNGSLRFAAYSPSKLDMTHKLDGDIYTMGEISYPVNTADTYEILVAPTTESYTAQTAASKVSVVFEHALSWLTLKVNATKDAENLFTVTKVEVNDILYKGSLRAVMSGADAAKTWTLDESVKSGITVYDNATTGQPVLTTPAKIETVNNGLIVLPQAPTTVTLTFNQAGYNGTPAIDGQTVTVPLVLDNATDTWEPGKHYTYNVIFDVDEILINPSIEDWEETTEVVVNTDPVKVTTSAQFVAAVAEGKSVVLEQDITLEEPVVVAPVVSKADAASFEVAIDLNGKNIVAPLFAEAGGKVTPGNSDSYAFWVKNGAKLTISGEGQVKTQACAYSMAVWAQGGEVVINGGHYENAGEGSDLVYASNGGKVTINGGTFKACEKQEGVDGTQEKYSALNLKGDNTGSSIVVYGGSFYGFNPSDNLSENPKVNFVAPGHNVVLDEDGWYNVTAYDAAVTLAKNTTLDATYQIAGGILDGAGKTLTVPATLTEKFYTASTARFINVDKNATVKNVVLDGQNASYVADKTYGLRAIYATGAGEVNIDNVTIQNVTYTFNDDAAAKTVNVSNSTFEGWTSYNASTNMYFYKVNFTVGTYGRLRPYGDTVVKNCAFAADFVIDLKYLAEGKTIVFENCTYNGQPLTAANLTDAEGKTVTIR